VTAVLRAIGLGKSFGGAAHRIQVLSGAELEVRPGELVTVAGSSGSGKSTLLHILGGLLHPDAGRVEVAGEDVYALSESRRAGLRSARVGFVFQFHHLLPEFTALENVVLPALIAGTRTLAARERAAQLLEAMGLGDRADHKPGELSGGEQQRVAVARALVNEPQVLLADEPSGNLDLTTAQSLHSLLEELTRARGVALIIATHSPSLAQRAHRSLVLREGSLAPLEMVQGWA
jgi:lipoprotein-releasing system ATP-binding protein